MRNKVSKVTYVPENKCQWSKRLLKRKLQGYYPEYSNNTLESTFWEALPKETDNPLIALPLFDIKKVKYK